MKSISNFIEQNIEIFSLCLIHWSILFILILAFSFLKYLDRMKRKKRLFFKIKKPVYIYVICLLLFIMLNASDTLMSYQYFLYFFSVWLFVFYTTCSFSTKSFLLLVFNLCFFCSTHIQPFISIQSNETCVYILLIFSIGILLFYFSWKKVALILFLLMVFNFFVLSFSCIAHSLNWEVLPHYVAYLIYTSIVLLYIVTFLFYYILSRVFYLDMFLYACFKLDRCNKRRFVLISLSLVMLSLCLRHLYIYNIFVYFILDYLDIIVLLNGTKNPHHDWVCGTGLKSFFGSHCRNMSKLTIYKQEHHTQMRKLYEEAKSLRTDMLQNNIPKEVGEVTTRSNKKISLLDMWHILNTHKLRHYACLVEKDDSSKCVAFVTHGVEVDGDKTLPLFENREDTSNLTRGGLKVDEEYTKSILPRIDEMQDNQTRRLNKFLSKNSKEHTDVLVNNIKINPEETITSVVKREEVSIQSYEENLQKMKQNIKNYKQNDSNNEVD